MTLKNTHKPSSRQKYITTEFLLDNIRATIRPKKRNCLFPVTVRKKNRVGRSVKIKYFIIFLVKNLCFMHVLR